MENNQQLQILLEQMEKNSRKQARYAKLQCMFSLAAVLCFAGLLVLLVGLLPQINETVDQLQNVAGQALELASQAEAVLSNLETVSQELASADLAGMVSDVDALVVSSQEGVTEALKKLDAMDIAALNKAISNLSAVVEPLAQFFKVFN